MTYEESRILLAKRLRPARYEHSLGVAETAARLARRFGVDVERARLAGLLHDNAREFPVEEMIRAASARGIPVTPIERAMPLLLHAPLGAYRLREVYGVTDEAIFRAVALHTVGGAAMTPLDKIVYFADMIEPGRTYKGVEALRAIGETGTLDEIMLEALSQSILYVVGEGQLVHPDTVTARNEILLSGTVAQGKKVVAPRA
ncbi:MAG: bis(5'-nucleosyl)-tetraphosphatase (symmetrical) YqeK [Schwartzia sp. (in: firmicutes)]